MTEINITQFPKAQRIGTPAPVNRSTFVNSSADPGRNAASFFGPMLV
ncbi:hypothetical protein DESA109040_09495 [Deinococcus saxicola]